MLHVTFKKLVNGGYRSLKLESNKTKVHDVDDVETLKALLSDFESQSYKNDCEGGEFEEFDNLMLKIEKDVINEFLTLNNKPYSESYFENETILHFDNYAVSLSKGAFEYE